MKLEMERTSNDTCRIKCRRGKYQAEKTELIVSSGQYETAATTITVRHTTDWGLLRLAKQLSDEHAVYGDNWAGWIPARVAIASPSDKWGENDITGGQHCSPANGWLEIDV